MKFCERGAEIAREESCLETSGCSNQADDPTAGRAEEEKGGMEKCRLLRGNRSLSVLIKQRGREWAIERERKKTEPDLQLLWFFLICRENTFFLSPSAASASSSFSSHPPGMLRNSSTLLPFIPHPSLLSPLSPSNPSPFSYASSTAPAAWMKPFEKGWSRRSSSLHGYNQVSARNHCLPTCLHSVGITWSLHNDLSPYLARSACTI